MNNRSSLAQKFNASINKCDICFSQYNRREKQPIIICTMHHTVCRQCVSSLEAARKCPFCRENIDFSKVVINNYIYQLLPKDPQQPNSRVQINRPIQQQAFSQQQSRPFMSQQNQQRSINYEPAQPVYPPDYYPHAQNAQYDPIALDEHQEIMNERPFDRSDCIGSIKNKLGLDHGGRQERKALYIIACLQLPFMIFDLLFARTGQDPKCYDTPYESPTYVLRPWLYAMGITQAVIILFMLCAAGLKICGGISFKHLKDAQYILSALVIIKTFTWVFMEIALFAAVITPHCSGGIFAYGIIQTFIHMIVLLVIGCYYFCKCLQCRL